MTEEMLMSIAAEGKTVFVREYLRHGYGKWEQVRSHYRYPPRL
jgi:hypothetical protein